MWSLLADRVYPGLHPSCFLGAFFLAAMALEAWQKVLKEVLVADGVAQSLQVMGYTHT